MADQEKNIPEKENEIQSAAQEQEQPAADPESVKETVRDEKDTVSAKDDAPSEVKTGGAETQSASPRDGDKKNAASQKESQEKPQEKKEGQGKSRPQPGPQSKRRRDNKSKPQQEADSEFIEKVLSIRRVTKVTKGGKKLSFSALVVVGDGKSRVGYAQEKAGEVAVAIRKAMSTAKKNMVKISLKGTTISHEIIGVHGGARVLLKPASEGTGVIASGPVRAVCDGAGIHNILTKCHRSNNPVNVVKAAMDGLTHLKTVNT